MLRLTVTTSGYAVGNFMPMAKKQAGIRRNYIREWREFRGLTQEELGELINRSKATVSRVENSEIAYTQQFLEAAAAVLGTHPGLLLLRAPTEADSQPPAGAKRKA